DTLAAHGLLSSPRRFRWYVRLSGNADALKAGVYDVKEGESTPQLVRLLTSGRAALRRLVVPEGLTLKEVAATVSQHLGVPAEDFLAAARDPDMVTQVRAATPTLEGYLFPSTYLVRYGATAPEIVAQMVAQFEGHWRPGWNARLDTLKL